MRYKLEIQCPDCKMVFNINIDSSSRTGYSYFSCKRCGKSIKIKLDQTAEIIDLKGLKSSSVHHLQSRKSAQTFDQQDKVKPQQQFQSVNTDEQLRSIKSSKSSKSSKSANSAKSAKPLKATNAPEVTDQLMIEPQLLPEQKIEEPYTVTQLHDVRLKPRGHDFKIMPNKRLYLAGVFLIIVFILGLLYGFNSMVLGTTDLISSDQYKPETSDISGKVIDNHTGKPIKNCKIHIERTDQYTVSNSDGQYFISNVKAGVHWIDAEAEGYIIIHKKVTVDPELMGVINFELDEGVGKKTIDESKKINTEKEQEINIFSLMIILFASFGLVASILAFKRQFMHICAFSGFISIFSIGFGFGIVLGILAFVLIVLSPTGFKKMPVLIDDTDSNKQMPE